MGIKDVVAFVDGRTQTRETLSWAARLAQEHDAHLTAVFAWPFLVSAGPEAFVRGDAVKTLLDAYMREAGALERTCRAAFEELARECGLRTAWRSVHTHDDLVVHARYADLAIVARTEASDRSGLPLDLPQSLVLSAGRPVVLLPPDPAAFRCRRVVLGWNASREAARAAADALPLLRRAEAVQVLVVDAHVRPNGHGEEPGADIAQHLVRHGANVEVNRVSAHGADAGLVILSEAASFGADLVVMGAYGHSRLTEFVFGGATRTALREADLPVLMSR